MRDVFRVGFVIDQPLHIAIDFMLVAFHDFVEGGQVVPFTSRYQRGIGVVQTHRPLQPELPLYSVRSVYIDVLRGEKFTLCLWLEASAPSKIVAVESDGMRDLQIAIPEEVYQALRLPPDNVVAELRKELAVALYARGILPFGKARLLAGIGVWEFVELLGARHVVRHYTLEDLQADLDYAQSGQQCLATYGKQ